MTSRDQVEEVICPRAKSHTECETCHCGKLHDFTFDQCVGRKCGAGDKFASICAPVNIEISKQTLLEAGFAVVKKSIVEGVATAVLPKSCYLEGCPIKNIKAMLTASEEEEQEVTGDAHPCDCSHATECGCDKGENNCVGEDKS